ncbi:MAG: acetolactate synthase small subunit [Lachnospiraceae bacterium]|nr:acetolactate synthase small subunit [Lachnospiraceae bacterium]
MGRVVLSLLVENNPGVTSRISGLFSRRGYNIDSISSGVTADPEYERVTIVTNGDDAELEQIEKQLWKLEDVCDIKILNPESSVFGELMFVKVSANAQNRQQIVTLTDIYSGKVVDVSKDSMIVRVYGTQDKLDTFIDLLDGYQILELARTGLAGLTRGSDDVKML